MSQHNITTLYIQDPNGGQPQMIKVVGAKANLTGGATVINSNGVQALQQPQQKTVFRAVTSQPDQQGSMSTFTPGTILTNKLSSGQIVTVPARSGTGNIIRPIIVPTSNVQQVVSTNNQQGIQARQFAQMSRPVVIRTQTNNGQITAKMPNGQITKVTRPIVNIQNPQHLQKLTTQIKPEKSNIVVPQEQIVQRTVKLEQTSRQPQIKAIQKPQQFTVQTQQQGSYSAGQPIKIQQVTSTPQTQQAPSPPKSLLTTSILDHSSGRKRHDFDFDYSGDNKRRKTEKCGKGLRHFSMKVCEKVKAKGRTSYNEVADELVAEFCEPLRMNAQGDVNDDQKNIRRRVYDALNVLMAMDIISKEKKEIHWLGLPTNTAQECRKLTLERNKRAERIKLKTQQMHDLILQQIAFKRLVCRNRAREQERGAAPPPNTAIHLPFVVLATGNTTTIDCSIANDKTEYLFNFDDAFEIHDDIEVLKRMGLALGLEKGECSNEDVTLAKKMLPKALESYIDDMAAGPVEPKVLSRDELVQQLGGVSIAGGEFGSQTGGGGGLLVMETSDALGGALGGVQRLTTEGGVLEGSVARSMFTKNDSSGGQSANSPASSVTVDEYGEEGDVDA